MQVSDNPFRPLPDAQPRGEHASGELQALPEMRPRSAAEPSPVSSASTASLHGFDLRDAPVLSGLSRLPGELVPARSTVVLRREMIGARVLVLFEDGDARRPIVVGVLQSPDGVLDAPAAVAPSFDVRADGERLTLSAEREIVLRCGDASITLTRAGRIVIQGSHVLSRSSGYNKIKGAAVDIN